MDNNKKMEELLKKMHDAFHSVLYYMYDNMPDYDEDYANEVSRAVDNASEEFQAAENEAKNLISC